MIISDFDQGYDAALDDVMKLCKNRKTTAERFNQMDVFRCWDRLEMSLKSQFKLMQKETNHENQKHNG